MRAEPHSVINELSDERRALWSNIADTHVIDEIKIRRLIKKLDALVVPQNLVNTSAAFALHEQGYLYAYLRKKENALKLFDAAENAGLNPMALVVSRAHSLYICGDFEQSREVLLNADIGRADASSLASIADGCVHIGLFKMAANLYVRAGKQSGEVSNNIVVAAELMDAVGATDYDVFSRIAAASKVIMEMTDQPHIALDIFAMHDEGILYRFMVKASVDRLVEIDSAIDEALSEFDDPIDQVLSVGIAAHEENVVISAEDGFHVRVQ